MITDHDKDGNEVMLARTSEPQTGASEATRPLAAAPGLRDFLRARRGVTAIEYGLVAALVAVVIIAAINTLGQTALTQLFDKVANSL
jgi:pilus assembly protein Flp/PilA